MKRHSLLFVGRAKSAGGKTAADRNIDIRTWGSFMNFKAKPDEKPDIKQLTARMARDNDRVACFVHGLASHVDRLVEATQKSDWDEVRRVCEFLMLSSSVYGLSEVASSAKRVCRELEKPDNTVEVKNSLLKLVGRCGTSRLYPWT